MARKPASPTALALEGDLDVFSVHGQWERVSPLAAGEGGAVTLDLAGLGDLDLSGVQLLCALDRDLVAKGGRLVLTGIKDEWKTRFSPMGFANLFEGGAA